MAPWLRCVICATVVALAPPAIAQAQQRVPDKNMFALGLSAGVALPAEDVLETGWFMAVSGEGYLTPRISVKGQFGGAFLDVDDDGLDGKVSPWHLTGSVVYNWEHGKWHPYAAAGIGMYKYRFGEGDDRPSHTKAGANLGGGIEYFFTRTDTITGDLTVHLVPGTAESAIFGYKAGYWTLAGGYKKYF